MLRRMKRWRLYRNQSGFSLGELLAIVAVIGIVSILATPAFISYSQAARLKGGAQELATILNQARQVAITRNTTTCVLQSADKVRFTIGTCASTNFWKAPGTDANGWFMLTEDVRVSAATANVVFTHLGTASTAGTYTVQNYPANNRSLHVIVALSGRITIGP
jgi:Tfp pilus assembly protein FimT